MEYKYWYNADADMYGTITNIGLAKYRAEMAKLPRLKLNSTGLIFVDAKVHHFDIKQTISIPSFIKRFVDPSKFSIYGTDLTIPDPYKIPVSEKKLKGEAPVILTILDGWTMQNPAQYGSDGRLQPAPNNTIKTLANELNDCGAACIRAMNNYRAPEPWGYGPKSLIHFYYFLYYLEWLLTSMSFIAFTKFVAIPEMKKDNYYPSLSWLTEQIAVLGGAWTPLNHPRYEIDNGHLKTSKRGHYHGLLMLRGLLKFYEEKFDVYAPYLPNIFYDSVLAKPE